MFKDIFSNKFSYDIFLQKYSKDGVESWSDTCERVIEGVVGNRLSPTEKATLKFYMKERKFIPGGRYLYGVGRPYHQVNNCFLARAEDSREGWADIVHTAAAVLMTGGGLGVEYSNIRAEGEPVKRTGGLATGPIALMQMVNEIGRGVISGGTRRSAIWAGLNWTHADIFKFLNCKNHSQQLKDLKANDFTFPLSMELTNISVSYDREFFDQYNNSEYAQEVWIQNCRQAFETAEPGMSFNYNNSNESLRNPCCEIVSEDTNDKCNLGTVWMNRCVNLQEFQNVIHLATQFLLCGNLYTDVPTEAIRKVGELNNRIGLGLGGMHAWLMSRGEQYEVTNEMHQWLGVYQHQTEATSNLFCNVYGLNKPKGLRAIAPTGTLSILAETTSGIEPLFCKAYLRRYLKDGTWLQQYVVDGTVKNLLEKGVAIESIQDSFDLSFEQRVKFQADVQDYVDMAISSTCNLPAWGSPDNNFTNVQEKADILLKYAPRLRGFTCYPDGCRAGQPLTRIDLKTALEQEGLVFEGNEESCVGGVCGV